jgi:hypothetical protein
VRRLGLAILVSALSSPSGAHAALTTGELLRWCDGPELAAQSNCNGYFHAFLDLAELEAKLTVEDQAIMVCVPAGISYLSLKSQLIILMENNVREHPELRDFPASIAVYALLGAGFPCQQKTLH